MITVIKFALEKGRYDLAAHALLLGLIKTQCDDQKNKQEREKNRILRTGIK
jgi:hypothetical protein